MPTVLGGLGLLLYRSANRFAEDLDHIPTTTRLWLIQFNWSLGGGKVVNSLWEFFSGLVRHNCPVRVADSFLVMWQGPRPILVLPCSIKSLAQSVFTGPKTQVSRSWILSERWLGNFTSLMLLSMANFTIRRLIWLERPSKYRIANCPSIPNSVRVF